MNIHLKETFFLTRKLLPLVKRKSLKYEHH
jgi:hypothetical protein